MKSKKNQKNCKTSWKCRKQVQKLLYTIFAKNLLKKFSNSENKENRKKFSEEFISHQRVTLDSQNAAETTLPWFLKNKNRNSFTRSSKGLGKNITLPKKIPSITSGEHVECRFFNPAKNLLSAVRKYYSKCENHFKNFRMSSFISHIFLDRQNGTLTGVPKFFPKSKNFSFPQCWTK